MSKKNTEQEKKEVLFIQQNKQDKLQNDLVNSAREEEQRQEEQLILMSDKLQAALNKLEKMCVKHELQDGIALLQSIKMQINCELREASSALEAHYTSVLSNTNMMALKESATGNEREPALSITRAKREVSVDNADINKLRWEDKSVNAIVNSSLNLQSISRSEMSALSLPEPDDITIKLEQLQKCPTTWATKDKIAVLSELKYKEQLTQEKHVHVRNSQQDLKSKEHECCKDELLMSAILLLTESMTTLLMCEVVRVYLYDYVNNLHCIACYPPHAVQADPMLATYTEIMLAKEVHEIVCTSNIAVNGSATEYNFLSTRDVETVKKEMERSGWSSMRSCLIFPINNVDGGSNSRAFGMIHAVNKISVTNSEKSQFTHNDEILMFTCARLLGNIFKKHHNSKNDFNALNCSRLQHILYSELSSSSLDDHLPRRLIDDVLDEAASLGNAVLVTPSNVLMYRASLFDVYQTRTLRKCRKKMSQLLISDKTLPSIEYNLKALNDAWLTGMDENVQMHQQFREQSEKLYALRQLLRNLLDGIAVTRAMQEAEEMARYLQKLELLGRSENTERMAEYISHTIIQHGDQNRQNEQYEHQQRLAITSTQNLTEVVKTKKSDNNFGDNNEKNCRMIVTKCSNSTLPISKRNMQLAEKDKELATLKNIINESQILLSENEESISSPFMTAVELSKLSHHQKSINKINANAIHIDGPEGVRTYSINETKKREQMQYIKNLSNKSPEVVTSSWPYEEEKLSEDKPEQQKQQQEQSLHHFLRDDKSKYYYKNNKSSVKSTTKMDNVSKLLSSFSNRKLPRPFKLHPPSKHFLEREQY